MFCDKKFTQKILAILVILLFLGSIGTSFLVLPASADDVNASPSSSWYYSGWQYRKAHDLTNNQPSTVYNFYSLSSAVATISGNPSTQHAMQPVHNSTIIEVDKLVDGNTWKYLAYDSDPSGSQINLFYTNDTTGTWTPYSHNPILGPQNYYYRWASVTYVSGVFQMFLEDYTGGTLERWNSTDGIHYTFVENVKSGGDPYKNPFIWFNPNDNRWYLYYHDSSGSTQICKARNATSIAGLRTANDIVVLNRSGSFASPTVMYYGGLYWMLGEILSGSIWQVAAYYSTSPTSGFVPAANSPILTNDVACPMVFLMPSQTQALLFTTVNSAAWYEMTQQINLTSPITPLSTSLSNYQVKITVNYGSGTSTADTVYLSGHCKTDFGDIRFTYFDPSSNSEVGCSYWIESSTVGSSAVFWIKAPAISGTANSTIYIYYGNSGVATTSNGSSTFEFFDDFSGDLSKWTNVGSGSWQIQNGELVEQGNSYGQRLRANNFVFANDSLHMKVDWTAGTYFESAACIRGQSPNEQNNGYFTLLSTWSGDYRDRIALMLNGGETTVVGQGTTNPSQNVWYTYVFSASGNFLKSTITPLYPTALTTTDSSFASGTLCLFDWALDSETVHYDNVFVTKYSNPEPTQGNWYNEETNSSSPPPASVTIDNSFVSDSRADIGTTQTVGYHAQWSNGSSINSGSIYVNGTQYAINSTGWATFNATSPPSTYKEATITKSIQASWIASDGTVYAGSGPTLYKSLDQGVTWQPLITFNSSNPTQIESVYINKLNYIFISPNATASTSDLGLWRSTDSGQTWAQVLQLPTNCNIRTIDEDSNGYLFAGVYTNGTTTADARIYRSINGGLSWDTVYYDSSARHIHCVAVDTSDNYIYAAVGDDVSPWNIHYIIRSTSDGDNGTWSKILTAMPQMTVIEIVAGARIFGTDATGNGQIYLSTDDASYTSVLNTGNSCYDFWIRKNDLNGNLYSGFVSNEISTYAAIYFSNNSGQTWSLYKTFNVQNLGGYYGPNTASNFVQGILYYSVQLNSTYQNGVKIYPALDPSKTSWAVTGVNCNGVVTFTQTATNPSVIWDQIKILNGGLTKTAGSLGDTVTVWFTANYQFDSTTFDGAKGTLYVNNTAMQWSTTNNRWEYPYTANSVGTTTLTVSSVLDNQYNLTKINNPVDGQNLYITDQPFLITTNSTITNFSFNSTAATLSFTVTGPSGTTGFMNLTISKTIIPNLSNLQVFIDGNTVSYSSSDNNYDWSILFTYHHSTHSVIIDFGTTQTTSNSPIQQTPTTQTISSTSPSQAEPKNPTQPASPQLPQPTPATTEPQSTKAPVQPIADSLNVPLIAAIVLSMTLSLVVLLQISRQVHKSSRKNGL